jgi:predicted RNA-binding Zn-ribbon protein involved in translation (DUF1610 family)
MKVERSINPEKFICPRCGGLIPSNDKYGEFIGAVSRHTRKRGELPLEVCSACGTEEAMEQHFGELTPREQYPIVNNVTIARRLEAISIIERHRENSNRVVDKDTDNS